MKPILRFSYFFVLGLAGIWLINGCKPGGNEASPQAACHIQEYTAVSTSRFNTENLQTTYSYDDQGKLLKIVTTYNKKPLNGADGTQVRTTTDIYTYNADGCLMTSTENTLNTTLFAGKTTEEPFSFVSNYSYTNGRLTAASSKYTTPYSSPGSPSITTFEYDSAGDLTKLNTGNQTWLYQKNQLVDYVGTERPYTIQNGQIIKAVFPGAIDELVTMDTFDGQNRLVKHEEYLNGQLNSYYVQTWSDAKPSLATVPTFKGFPPISLNNISLTLQSLSQKGALATYKQYYWNSISKTMQPFTEDTHTVQANGQRFISAATIVSKHPLAADQDYTTTETYTYTGCQ